MRQTAPRSAPGCRWVRDAWLGSGTPAVTPNDATLAGLLKDGPLAVAIFDGANRFVYANQRLAGVRTAADYLGCSIRDISPAVADQVEALVARVLAGGGPVLDVELAITRDRRRWRTDWYLLTDEPDQVGQVGQVGQVAMLGVDVGELVDLREALRSSEARAREISATLYRTVVPPSTPTTDELEIAVRHRTASPDGELGGQWYDVVELGAGRLGVVVGDVTGAGVPAVAAMGQLRTALRTCSRQDMAPVDVLNVLDGLIADLVEPVTATCVYAVFDPHGRDLELASAGHLPPMLRTVAGGAQLVSTDTSAPLGLGDAARRTRVPLPPGGVLALYTKGLLATGDADVDNGVLALAGALVKGPEDLEVLADVVVDTFSAAHPEPPGYVLLLLRLPADIATRSRSVVLPVPRDRGRSRELRELVREAGQSWTLLPDVTDRVVLLTSELVTNALVHGQGRIEVRLRLTRDRLVVEVADQGHQLPRRMGLREQDERGRGLQLVALLSHRWGARPALDGKVVWAELDLASV